MTALTDGDWRITYLPAADTGLQKAETVRAAYPDSSDALPGWTLLKDCAHQIVKMVRSDGVQSIERIPSPATAPAATETGKLRYAPDATARYDQEAGGIRVGDECLMPYEVMERGFARKSSLSFGDEWVQADGFQVRGLFRRGDAQRFTPAELRELVIGLFAERGVQVPDPRQLEAFCFNYEPAINLDQARERAAADMASGNAA